MVAYYPDASATVKGYIAERGSERVLWLLDHEAGHELYLSRMGMVEIAAALFGKVRAEEASLEEALAVVARLRAKVSDTYQVVEVNPAAADRAIEVAERHRLRAYDCLQLATALLIDQQRAAMELAPLVLVSSDGELNAAVRDEGLTVEDPAV